jgi:hypothetical protein
MNIPVVFSSEWSFRERFQHQSVDIRVPPDVMRPITKPTLGNTAAGYSSFKGTKTCPDLWRAGGDAQVSVRIELGWPVHMRFDSQLDEIAKFLSSIFVGNSAVRVLYRKRHSLDSSPVSGPAISKWLDEHPQQASIGSAETRMNNGLREQQEPSTEVRFHFR